MQKAVPIFAAEKDEGKLRDALGLHEREDFKKFVERAETTGHENEAEAVFHEAYFAREKVMEMNRHIGKTIPGLFVRQLDVEAHGFASGLHGSAIGGFHDAGSATSDDGEILFGEAFADSHGGAIIFVRWLGSRRAENGHSGADLGHGLEGIHEFRHNAENAPGVFVDEIIGIGHCHGRRLRGILRGVKLLF